MKKESRENKLFSKLCRMPQKALKAYLVKELNMIEGDGYAFYEGTFPVLLTAHMDTVHKNLPGKIYYTKTKDEKIEAWSPNGIGGDDRCGVYMILKLMKQLDCSVLFCEDEEIGSVGAGKFIKTDLCKRLKDEKKFKYIIELDRANSNDAVFYDDDNDEFHDFVTKEFWKESFGSWSDICELSPALEISSVNLSCGYYHQHTKNEYVILEEMEKAIEETYQLLMRTDLNAEPFKFVEVAYCYGKSLYNGYANHSGYGYNNGSNKYASSYDDYYDDYYGYRGYNADNYRTNKAKSNSNYLSTNNGTEIIKYGNTSTKTKEIVYLEVFINPNERVSDDYLMEAGSTADEAWKNLFFNNPKLCYEDIYDYYYTFDTYDD